MKKTIYYLSMIGILFFTGIKVMAHHQDDFPGIKNYENIQVFSGKSVTLSWVDTTKVDSEKIMSDVKNENLSLLSQEENLNIKELEDSKGNVIVLIEGKDELLKLTYIPGKVKRPYNLLEFKVEDGIISKEQFSYIRNLVKYKAEMNQIIL